MVYSQQGSDYKFPGGGILRGEAPDAALSREVGEETGAKVTSIGEIFARVIEYDHSSSPQFDVFQMTSSYFICSIADGMGSQNLDEYEKAPGFTAVWVQVAAVIAANHILLKNQDNHTSKWVRRETFILEAMQHKLILR